MEWGLLKRRFSVRLNRDQKKALSGKTEMTKELFWRCLDVFFKRHEMDKFWELWHAYPQYIQEKNAEFDREMADPNSELRKEHDKWWADLKPKLVEAFGEDWVKENCRD
jgi:phytoene/squalene synthetase